MTIEEYRNYCLEKTGVTESMPFHNLPDVLVFKVGEKMFAAANIDNFASFSVRCKPETIDELRARFPAVREPSYFSKRHWSRIELDGSIPDNILREFLDTSYEIAFSKLTKKFKKGISKQ